MSVGICNNYDNDDEEQVSECESPTRNDDVEQVSECESPTRNDDEGCYEGLFGDNVTLLDKEDDVPNVIKNKFWSCLSEFVRLTITIVAIHKKCWSALPSGQARLSSFEAYRRALFKQGKLDNDDNRDNLGYAWYSTSRDSVARIMKYGFGCNEVFNINGFYSNHAVCLYPLNCLDECIKYCLTDNDGLKHIILCRVLLEDECVISNSSSSPSSSSDSSRSEVVDDNVVSPSVYAISSTKMNTHILPEFIITFKSSSSTGSTLMPSSPRYLSQPLPHKETSVSKPKIQVMKKPQSRLLPMSRVISTLANYLPPSKSNQLCKHHKDFKDKKISRLELIRSLKNLAGVKFWGLIARACGEEATSSKKGLKFTKSSTISIRYT